MGDDWGDQMGGMGAGGFGGEQYDPSGMEVLLQQLESDVKEKNQEQQDAAAAGGGEDGSAPPDISNLKEFSGLVESWRKATQQGNKEALKQIFDCVEYQIANTDVEDFEM